jgi:hypothetical protein
MIRQLSKIAILILLGGVTAFAQGVRKDDFIINQAGKPIPNATVTICSSGATGVPCTPTATIYSDAAETMPIAGSTLTTGPIGNFGFYATPGEYVYTVTGSTINAQSGHYSIGCTPSAHPGGCGGSGSPGGSTTQLQYNSSSTFAGAAGITTPDGNSLNIKGPTPWTDIIAFGGHATNGPLQTTADYASGNATLTLPGGIFINGDGVTVQGAGASVAIGTPGAPTITPQYANAPTRTHIMSSSPTGASSYTYCVVAEDIGQGLTPCSSTTAITNGPASLGLQSVNISSVSLSNDTLTVNTSSGTFVSGMMVDVLSSVARLGGIMRTSTGSAGTLTVSNFVYDSRFGPVDIADVPNSVGAGGTVDFYQANTISWTAVTGARRYWVCADRPGDSSLHVIGQSDFSSGTFPQTQFEDYGPTYLASQSFPYYITDAICTGSGQNDALTTTVASGGGTIHPVLTVAPSQTDNTNTKVIILDNGPALIAAANQAGNGIGCIFISPTSSVLVNYAINSYTSLPGGICIIQSGGLQLNDTLNLTNVYWQGWNNQGVQQFGFNHGADIQVIAANPAVHLIGTGDFLSKLDFHTAANGTVMVNSDNSNTVLDTINCSLPNADVWGECIKYRTVPGGVNLLKILNGSSFESGPSEVTDASWTPLIDVTAGSSLVVKDFSGARRSISGCYVDLDHYYIQGAITPIVTFISTGGGNCPVSFNHVISDTSGSAMLAALGGGANVFFHTYINASATNTVVSGTRPNSDISDGYFYSPSTNPPARWMENCAVNTISTTYETVGHSVGQQQCFFGNQLMMQGGYPIFWPLAAPATPTLSGPSAGGSMPSGTFEYALSATGFDGAETVPSPIPSAQITTGGGCPGAGNCTVTVNWVAVVGAQSYNIYRCNTAASGGCSPIGSGFVSGGNWDLVASHQTGTSFNDTTGVSSINGFSQVTATGISQLDAKEALAPQHVSAENTAPTGVPGFDQEYADSTAHRWLENSNGGSTWLERSLVVCAGVYALDTNLINNNARDVKSYNTCPLFGSAANINHLTDHVSCSFQGDPNGVTGYAVSAPFITLRQYIPTGDGAFDIDQINQTGSGVTPGAQNVLCSVTRP